MKIVFYKLFRKSVYRRAFDLRMKQQARMSRLRQVVSELREWHDIPISWQFKGFCETLNIKPNEAAYSFILRLLIPGTDLNEAVKKLPLK